MISPGPSQPISEPFQWPVWATQKDEEDELSPVGVRNERRREAWEVEILGPRVSRSGGQKGTRSRVSRAQQVVLVGGPSHMEGQEGHAIADWGGKWEEGWEVGMLDPRVSRRQFPSPLHPQVEWVT